MKGVRIFLLIILVFGVCVLLFDQNRKFYRLPDGKCITVWKRIGGTCLIIPGEYFWVLTPSVGYIKTTNDNDATIYWKNGLPSTIIVRIDKTTRYEIFNGSSEIMIEDYNNNPDAYLSHILYSEKASRFREVNPDVDYISVCIKENYARDKLSNKL